ncbi:MAG: Ig-like domain-containing protein [Gemmatimonadales bacterium]|jgi:hypothetical protein
MYLSHRPSRLRAAVAGLTLVLIASGCSRDATGPDSLTEPDEAVIVAIDPASATLRVGETLQLSAISRGGGRKASSGHTVMWSTDDPSIADVSSDGVVNGMAVGTATITAAGKGQEKHGQGATAAISVVDPPAPSALAVFPGAEGFGVETPAGRHGAILKVTNLDDSGPGSLRAALGSAGPRTIVFEVAGTIALSADLDIREPFVTLAGQTAPSPGITLRGAGLRVFTNDVLIQHIRIRVGDAESGPDPKIRDALQVLGPHAYNVVVDHISASWAIDEVVSTWYPLHDVTIRNSIIAEGLHQSLHPEGPHSTGLLIGDESERVAVIGNLFAHNYARNPQFKGGTSGIVANNLIYDPGYQSVRISDAYDTGPSLVSVVGNVLVTGPSTINDYLVSIGSSTKEGTGVYLADNIAPTVLRISSDLQIDPLVGTPPIWTDPLTLRATDDVRAWVLAHAGARPADRDAVDLRIVSEVVQGGGRIINSQTEVGGWPAQPARSRLLQIPTDPFGDSDGDGYTNLEEWLHAMAAEVEATS